LGWVSYCAAILAVSSGRRHGRGSFPMCVCVFVCLCVCVCVCV
jgi:hypothetical protein